MANPKYTYYKSNGVPTEDEHDNSIVAFIADHGKHKNHYVKMSGSKMFDVLEEKDVFYTRRHVWRDRKVLESAFNLYIRFLESKQITYLRKAERAAL